MFSAYIRRIYVFLCTDSLYFCRLLIVLGLGVVVKLILGQLLAMEMSLEVHQIPAGVWSPSPQTSAVLPVSR